MPIRLVTGRPSSFGIQAAWKPKRAREVAQITERLKPITNPKMASDLTVAAALARAAIEGALANVEINLESLTDADFTASIPFLEI